MTIILAGVLLYFFVLPLIGGAIAFISGGLRPQFRKGKDDTPRISPFNPFYQNSPFNLR
ncbi:hypothetical protein [Craterilacuibacter sp.]|uniref:hypothetical protein n=1 Tax=Craterilacuibacter sp. TaxID=2870909 RepID=UPI003F2FF0EA